MLLVPAPGRDTGFFGNDGKDLTPQRESGDGGHRAKRRDVEWVYPRLIDDVICRYEDKERV